MALSIKRNCGMSPKPEVVKDVLRNSNRECRTVSLLHLPNELLLQILEHLCRDFADNDHGRPTAGPTIDLLLVCRRLYPLAVSLRLRKIRLKGETTDVDSILAYLIRTLGAFEAVHELEVHLNSVVEYDMVLPAILSRLTHLCALRIVDDPDESGDDDDDDLADSWCRIDELLIRCSNLRYLELDPARLVDEVDFATCVRPIRHLAMNAANNSLRAVSFLQNAQPTRLCLHVTASAAPPELAWETLQQLEIEFAPGLAGLPTAFLTTLRNVLYSRGGNNIALDLLAITIRTTDCDLNELLLRTRLAFMACNIGKLLIRSIGRGFDISALPWVWPTLRTLELAMPHTGISRRLKSFKHSMKALATALPEMPDLIRLTLVNVNLSECDCCAKPTVDRLLAPEVDLSLDFPALHVFLQHLVRSSVLDFRIRTTASAESSELGVEARCQRTTRSEEFTVERWTVE
ncbi:hypothetical protein BMF94_3100 [Rhodotorula taiwanensis]|uniref:F-box domain-containing protein n=1 Tax=Rhodotorula taiwanensis TaxID=741276 RepID=A0A2S5BAT5_9BASI|nr:hypothetical protein BMF94_3100 [Rhodotorula taiwanensis]